MGARNSGAVAQAGKVGRARVRNACGVGAMWEHGCVTYAEEWSRKPSVPLRHVARRCRQPGGGLEKSRSAAVQARCGALRASARQPRDIDNSGPAVRCRPARRRGREWQTSAHDSDDLSAKNQVVSAAAGGRRMPPRCEARQKVIQERQGESLLHCLSKQSAQCAGAACFVRKHPSVVWAWQVQ